MQNSRKLDGRELIAAVISAALVLASIGYWIVQTLGVIEMLKLAYG